MTLPSLSIYRSGAMILNCRSGNQAGVLRVEGGLVTAGWYYRASDDDLEDANEIVYSPKGDGKESNGTKTN